MLMTSEHLGFLSTLSVCSESNTLTDVNHIKVNMPRCLASRSLQSKMQHCEISAGLETEWRKAFNPASGPLIDSQ